MRSRSSPTGTRRSGWPSKRAAARSLAITTLAKLALTPGRPEARRRFARGFDRDARALPQLGAAAGQGGGLGGVARQLDGLVVRRARLLTAAQPAQQVGAGRMVGVIAGQPGLKTV